MQEIKNIPFIGGDTASFDFDFGTKVAGSVTECPCKIYKGMVDPNNLLSPLPVNYSNLVINGDFSNGENEYVFSGCSHSIFNGELITLANVQYGRPTYPIAGIDINAYKSHKLYGSIMVKADTKIIQFAINDGSHESCTLYSGSNIYEKLSAIWTVSVDATHLQLILYDNRSSGWTNIYSKQWQLIDLTALFGAGKEPDKEWCDANLPFVLTSGTCNNPPNFYEVTDQSDIDKIKSQDGTTLDYFATAEGKSAAYLLEYDLTNICNAIFGGSNATMKAALKTIQIDVWAVGSGNNAGILGNSVRAGSYYNVEGGYGGANKGSAGEDGNVNDTALLSDMFFNDKRLDILHSDNYSPLMPSNKLYMIVFSIYPSSTTISSKLSLDYVKLKVDFSRVPDMIAPVPVNLKDEWTIIVKGFSPAWDMANFANMGEKAIFSLVDSAKTILELYKVTGGDQFRLWENGVYPFGLNMNYNIRTLLKYQMINFALCKTNEKYTIYILVNNSVLFKCDGGIFIPPMIQSGKCDLYLNIFHNTDGTNISQSDAFMDKVQIYNRTFTDAEIEAKLRDMPELCPDFNDSRWQIDSEAIVSSDGKSLLLNANAIYRSSYIILLTLPNNKYRVQGTLGTNNGQFKIYVTEYYNDILVNGWSAYIDYTKNFADFITSDRTNNVHIACSNLTTTGVCKYSNLSLKILM